MDDFWLSFLAMTDPLVQNIGACHAKHLTDNISSTYDMLPGLMAYDNYEYGRWLPDYWVMLSLLSDEQMAFFSDHFTQLVTGQPYTCQPLGLRIETTMNLNSKLKQGWLQLLQNHKKLFLTTRNANNVARVKAARRRNLNCQNLHRKHVECQAARVEKDEQAETILHEQGFTKTRSLTVTIHRNKRRNFANEQIYVPSGASMNVALMERSGMLAVVDFAEGAGMLKLESGLDGRVTGDCGFKFLEANTLLLSIYSKQKTANYTH